MMRSLALQSAAVLSRAGRVAVPAAAAQVRMARPATQVWAACLAAGPAGRMTAGLRGCAAGMATISGPVETKRAAEICSEGNEALEAGRPHDALAKYLDSIKLVPTSEALFNAGNVYLQLSRPQDALNCYAQSLELGEHPDTLINMANVEFLFNKRHDEAIRLYERALKVFAQIHYGAAGAAAGGARDPLAAAAAAAAANPVAAALAAAEPFDSAAAMAAEGEIWFNLGCVCDAAAEVALAGAAQNPEHLEKATHLWEKAESAFASAVKAKIERADMFKRNVAVKRVSKVHKAQQQLLKPTQSQAAAAQPQAASSSAQ